MGLSFFACKTSTKKKNIQEIKKKKRKKIEWKFHNKNGRIKLMKHACDPVIYSLIRGGICCIRESNSNWCLQI